MKFQIPKGETGVILTVFIQDNTKTTGEGLAGLIETSSIVGGFVKRNGLGVALVVDENVAVEGTYEAPTTAGQVRIGTPVNMRAGWYELHFHNDLFTTADWVDISLGGATNMADLAIEVQLTTIDLNTALASSTIGTCTTNTDMRGTDGVDTATMRGTDGANTTTPPTTAAITAAVWDELMAELIGDAGATPKMRELVALLYMWLRNNTQDTSTTRKILNDAGATILTGTMADDGTTFTQGKLF